MKKQKILTRKNKLRVGRFTAVLLSLSLLFQTVAFADDVILNSTAEIDTSAPVTETRTETETTEITDLSELNLVSEDESKRGETEKHFLCEDGSFVAVSYGTPVHYKDEDGIWQEIDNTLEETEIDGITAYTNKDGIFDVEFSAEGESLVTIEKDGYTVSWDVTAKSDARLIAQKILEDKISAAFLEEITDTLENEAVGGNLAGQIEANAAIGEIAQIDKVISRYNLSDKVFEMQSENAEIKEKDTEDFTEAEKLTTALKATSELTFESAFDEEIDLEYVVTPTTVKENIILNSVSEITSYVTTLTAEELTAELKEDNSIELKNVDGEVIFIIAAPYMFDAEHEESFDFEVTLENGINGEYIITYTPSLEWLSSADRVYPVTVDPTVKTVNSLDLGKSNIVDTYVVEGEGGSTNSHNLEQYLYIGKNSSDKTYYTFVRLKKIPEIPKSSTVTEARFTLFLDAGRTHTGKAVNIYSVMGSWESGTITYSNKPSIQTTSTYSNIAMRHNSSTGRYYYSFDVSSTISNIYSNYWATGTMSCGNGFAITHSSLSSGSYDKLYSAEYSGEDYRPHVWIRYEAPVCPGAYTLQSLTATMSSGTYKWLFEVQDDNSFYMRNYDAMSVYLGYSSSSSVALYNTVSGNENNLAWKLTKSADGSYWISPKAYPTKVLSVPAGCSGVSLSVNSISLETKDSTLSRQRWDVSPTESSSEFIWPFYNHSQSSRWGYRIYDGGSGFHYGIDIGTGGQTGKAVNAMADGYVVYNQEMGDYGLRIVIVHSNGYCTVYQHLARNTTTVNVGDFVKRGTKIAEAGDTGGDYPIHLHFEVWNEYLNNDVDFQNTRAAAINPLETYVDGDYRNTHNMTNPNSMFIKNSDGSYIYNTNFNSDYDNDSMYTGNDLIQGEGYWKYNATHWG